eukprot:g680.t1
MDGLKEAWPGRHLLNLEIWDKVLKKETVVAVSLAQFNRAKMMQEQNDKTVSTGATNEAIEANPMLMGLQEPDFHRLVPGERAKQLRSEQANIAARAVVGDEQLEAAMPLRREQLSEKTRRDVLGSIEQPPTKKRRTELELIEDKIAMIGARKRLCIAEFTAPLDAYKGVLELLGIKMDDRDKLFFADEARNSARQAVQAMRSTVSLPAITATASATVPQPVVAKKELAMTDVFLQLASSPRPAGAERTALLIKAGKLAAARYRARHQG